MQEKIKRDGGACGSGVEKVERRGGARAGAGRPAKADRTCAIGVKVSALAKERLQAYAASMGVSMAEALNMLLESL